MAAVTASGAPISPLGRVGRTATAATLLACGIAVMVGHVVVRTFEAKIGAAVAEFATGTTTMVVESTQAFFWLRGTSEMRGLRVTPECTAAFILGPLLLGASLVTWSRRLALRRILMAVAASVGLVLAMVSARLGLIAWATYRFGPEDGYRWSHTIGGSLVSIVGVIAALAVFVGVAFRERRPGFRS